MDVAVFCEFSGAVRDAFIAKGHNAISFDFLPSDRPGPHVQGDVLDVLKDVVAGKRSFDLMIGHPPCTLLTNAANRWLTDPRYPNRIAEREGAIEFFNQLLHAPIPKICIENPVPNGYVTARVGKYAQTIQPYQFGHPESKRTCLWLKGLPPLIPTNVLTKPESGHWDNQTPSGQNRYGPSADRWKIRSVTYEGFAKAFADQWG